MWSPTTGKPTRRWLASLGILLLLILAVWYSQHQGVRAVTASVARQAEENCREIESLKTLVRQEAIDNYEHLAKNAKLLNLKVTPELRSAAREARDARLARYAKDVCPRVETAPPLPGT